MEDGKKGKSIHRRDFVVGSAAAATLVGLGCSDDNGNGPTPDGPPPGDGPKDDLARDLPREGAPACQNTPQPLPAVTGPARVVEVHDDKSVSTSGYDAARVKAMLIAGVQKLADVTDTKQAWTTLIPGFAASMRIGIKVNCLNNNLYNSGEVLTALIDSLVNDLGADSGKIWVWDRRTDELTRSKLSQASLGVKVAGTVASTSDLSGPGYEAAEECVIDRATHVSKILTTETDITINVALLKTHNISGITGALKNVYGCIDNPGDFHADFNTYMPALYRLDSLRKPMVLHITEGLKAVTKGDTTDYPDAMPGRILLSSDPLALDAHALELVNTLRANDPKNLKPLPADRVKWVDEAAKLNLGTKTIDPQIVTMS